MTLSYTPNLHLAVPDFLSEPWHGEFAQAMDSIDRIMYQAIIAANTTLWMNSTVYVIGALVINPDSGGIYSAAVAHTSSPSPQTFTGELASHPTFWSAFAPTLASQAEAEAGTDNTKYMSPLRVAQAIDVQSIPAQIASQPEAVAGLDNTKMMTPLRVSQALSGRLNIAPQGRLTLISDSAIMAAPMENTNLIYYTPYTGTALPIWNGTNFDVVDLWDQLVANTEEITHNPGALAPGKVNDWFVWTDSAPVTITIGAPTVVNYAGSGLVPGQPLQFTTTGTLPAGLTPSTIYYVAAPGWTGNTFQISASRGGPSINTTASQTGTHTLTSRRLTHGPDWTTDNVRALPLQKIKGIWVNGAAITNGPGPGGATYVGSTRSVDSGPLLSWRPYSFSLAQSPLLLVYNAYNRIMCTAAKQDPTLNWQYNGGVERNSDNSPSNRIWALDGLGEGFPTSTFSCTVQHDQNSYAWINILMQRSDGGAVSPVTQRGFVGLGYTGHDTSVARAGMSGVIGVFYAQARENGVGTPVTFFGDVDYAMSMAMEM